MSTEDTQAEVNERYHKLKEKLPVHIDYEYIDRIFEQVAHHIDNDDETEENTDIIHNLLNEIEYILDDIEDEISVITE